MSLLDEKQEELKERRSDALNGIVSSEQDIAEITTQDNLADDYLFGNNQNPVGILYLLSLYQQERVCEKAISYYINDLGISNVEGKIWTDISNVMNSTAEPPRFSTNYFYYIDSDYNISVNDGTKDLTGTKNSLIYNNGETSGASLVETRADTVVDDLGESYPDDDFISGGYEELENSNRGSGFLKYWNSHNKVSAQGGGGGEEPTYTIGGEDRIWIWHTTTLGGYQTQGHITSLLTDLKTLIDKLTALSTILTNIKTARYQMTTAVGQVFWEKMSISDDTITPDQITYINECKNTLNNYYTPLYEERETNDEWIDDDTPSGSLFNKLNSAINGLVNFGWSGLISFMTTRFSTSSSVLGTDNVSGLRKWINFWLTEKISLENGTYSSLYFLNQSIADEKKELAEAENRLNAMFPGDSNVIPTPRILAVYSDPLFDKSTGKTIQNRLGVVWEGQLHTKKYKLYRKSVKAFDYYGSGSLSFKWDNSNWTKIGTQLGDWKNENITEIDPENGFVITEILLPTENDAFYLFRISEEDSYNYSAFNPAYSYQSPIVGESKIYSNIINGIIKYKNHGFKRGDFILIKSSGTNANNPINGFYRVADTDENSFVLDSLINSNISGTFYKISGAGTIKPLPYVSYDENGKPSLSSRS